MNRRLIVIAAALLALGGGVYLWKRRGGDATDPAAGSQQVSDPLARLRQTPLRTRWAPAVCKPSGIVRTRDGAPAAGAVVTLHTAPLSPRLAYEPIDAPDVRSGADGRYQLPATAAGSWTLVAALPDVRAAVRAITITAGGDCGNLDLTLGVSAHAVTGTVVDVNGGGVKEAMVVARAALAPTGPPVALAMTALDGGYRLAAPEGDYLIQVRHPDYVGVDGTIAVRGPTTFDATLTPGSSVRGTVLTHDRNPIPGARVTIRGGRASGAMGGLVREVTTDDDGKFTATGLGSGRIFLSAVGPSHANRQPLEIALGIAENRTGVELFVDPARRIRGVVTLGGQPAPNALVTTVRADLSGADEMAVLFGGDLTGADHPVETDASGVFEVWGLVPGVYSVTAVAPSALPSPAVKADVTRGDADAIALALAAGVVVRGRVEPPQVANVSISGGISAMAEAARWIAGGTVESGPDGTFAISGVEPGPVNVTAETYSGLSGETQVEVAATGANDVVVRLARKGVPIAGRVVDPSGKPVANVTVGSFGVTSTDGTFRGNVEPADYTIFVSDTDEELEVIAPKLENNTINVPAGGLSDLRITVEARDRTLRGIVIGADGKPAPDAWVVATRALAPDVIDDVLPGIDLSSLAFDWTGRTKVALTDADGRFAIANLRKGSYDVAAEGAKGAARGVARGVDVDRGVRIQLVALGGLEVVVAQGGKPVTRYTLTIEGPEPDTRTVEAADGRFTLTSIPPGDYKLRATTDGAVGSVGVAVGQGATAKASISLAGWATVTGTVVDATTGAPLVGVTAWIDDAATMLTGDTAPWITDAAGKFKLERVPPGKGEVIIYTGGGEPVHAPFTATEGATFDLGTIRAKPAPPVEPSREPTGGDIEPAIPEPTP